MSIRIYDIAKKLGLLNKEVLDKARDLGITAAKLPSSSLDRITAEYLETELTKEAAARHTHEPLSQKTFLPVIITSEPKAKVAINATGSELFNLVEKILAGEVTFTLNVSRSENSEPLCVTLTRETSEKHLGSAKIKQELPARIEIDEKTKDLLRAAYYASRHNSTDGWVNLAEYGNAVKRLEPTFQAQSFGERSLGSLLRRVTELFELRNDETNPIVYFLRLKDEKPRTSQITAPQIPTTPLGTKLATGKVHNLKLGFGFIMPDDGSENLFFHATDVETGTIFDLKPGDSVEYEPGVNEKGPCAKKVRRLSS